MALRLCFKASDTDCDEEGLKTQMTKIEQEKTNFKGYMEKEREKLKRSQWKFESELIIFS